MRGRFCPPSARLGLAERFSESPHPFYRDVFKGAQNASRRFEMSLQTLIQYFDILGHSRPSSPGSAPAILSGSVPVMLSGGGSPRLVDLPGWISSGSAPALLRSRPIVLSPGRSIPTGELLQSSRFSHFPEMINYKSAIHYRPGNRVSCYHNKKGPARARRSIMIIISGERSPASQSAIFRTIHNKFTTKRRF